MGHTAAGYSAATRDCQVCFHQKGSWDERLEQQVWFFGFWLLFMIKGKFFGVFVSAADLNKTEFSLHKMFYFIYLWWFLMICYFG